MVTTTFSIPKNAQAFVLQVLLIGSGPHPGSTVLGASDEDALVRGQRETVDAVRVTLKGFLQVALALLAELPRYDRAESA